MPHVFIAAQDMSERMSSTFKLCVAAALSPNMRMSDRGEEDGPRVVAGFGSRAEPVNVIWVDDEERWAVWESNGCVWVGISCSPTPYSFNGQRCFLMADPDVIDKLKECFSGSIASWVRAETKADIGPQYYMQYFEK